MIEGDTYRKDLVSRKVSNLTNLFTHKETTREQVVSRSNRFIQPSSITLARCAHIAACILISSIKFDTITVQYWTLCAWWPNWQRIM